jgi:beta-barrel assembly-enhancing protease
MKTMNQTKLYEAILMDSTSGNVRYPGKILINNSSIVFNSEDQEFKIPFLKLSISAGGAGNRLIFLSNHDNADISIYTSDKSILKNEILLDQKGLIPQIKSSKKVGRKLIISSLLFFGFICISIFGIYLCKDFFVEKLANQVPRSWEKKMGDQLFSALSSQYKIVKNDSLSKVFLEVAKPLIQQIEKEGVKIDLYFVNDPSINAFALPGGKVVIQSGLLDNAKSWEEVMGVMSHELAHVTRRHHLRGIITNMGLYAIISSLLGDITAIGGVLTSTGGQLASLSNSRSFETEADDTGWKYLVKSKINPKGMIDFFKTLEKEHKKEAKLPSYMSFMSTHPETKDRILNLTLKLSKEHLKFNPISNNYQTFYKAFNLSK